jgi:glucose-1-phosphate cytidylyltransferase
MTKVVLLVGGKGSRLNSTMPKPLVEIGNIPLVQHVMNTYNHFGYDDFILLTGHRHEEFVKYFNNNKLSYGVELLYTGKDANTGERIKQVKPCVNNSHFCLSYGDGLTDANLLHIENLYKQIQPDYDIMVTVVNPPERYGLVDLEDTSNDEISKIKLFNEKPKRNDWINGGFMICNNSIFDYIEENDIFEQASIPKMVENQKACAYKYYGNWQCVDTQKDLNLLTDMWNNKNAFWDYNRKE